VKKPSRRTRPGIDPDTTASRTRIGDRREPPLCTEAIKCSTKILPGRSSSSASPGAAERAVSTMLPPREGSPELLELLGHRPACVELSRAGLVASCDCPPSRLHDPAIVVGVVMHYARIALAQQAALPTVVVELLMLHVHAGDSACIMVADLLARNGLIDQPLLPRFGKRIRS